MEKDITLTKNDKFLLIQIDEDEMIAQSNCMGALTTIVGVSDIVKSLSEETNVSVDEILSTIKDLTKSEIGGINHV